MFINKYPYTDFHELNLDFILNIIEKIKNENAKLITDFNDLYLYVHDYFKNLDVSKEINAKLDEMYQDGSLEVMFEKYRNVVSVKNYGAIGDGVTSDVAAFRLCESEAIDKLVYIPEGTYNLEGIQALKIPYIIGENATLKLGENDYIEYSGKLNISNLTINKTGAGVCIVFNPDVHTKKVVLNNVSFTGNESLAIGVRILADSCNLKNLTFNNIARGIIVSNTADIKPEVYNISDITGYNVATLVDVEGYIGDDYTKMLKNVHISNVSLINTPEQKATILDEVGKDAVLITNCDGFSVNNINSRYARERTVYANMCSNGNINGITTEHSQSIKICGNYTKGNIAHNITCSNIIGNELDDGYILTVYDVDNLSVSNIQAVNTSDANTSHMIELNGSCNHITLDGITVEGSSRGLFLFRYIDGRYNLIKNITIKNVLAKNLNLYTGYAPFRTYASSVQSASWIQDLMIDNVSINPNQNYIVSYGLPAFINMQSINRMTVRNSTCRGLTDVNNVVLITGSSNVVFENVILPTPNRNGWIELSGVNEYRNVRGITESITSGIQFTSTGVRDSIYNGRGYQSLTVVQGGEYNILTPTKCTMIVSGPINAVYTFDGASWTHISGDILTIRENAVTLTQGKYLITYTF